MDFVLIYTRGIRPGCESCMHCRVVCDNAITSVRSSLDFYGNREDDMRTRSKIHKGSDPPLPIQMQVWMDGWTERRGLWRERMPGGYKKFIRFPHCGRHRGFFIDGYTLDGVYIKSFL
jgi:hypothetical protein